MNFSPQPVQPSPGCAVLHPEDIAAALELPVATINRLARQRRITHFRLSERLFRFNPESLQRIADETAEALTRPAGPRRGPLLPISSWVVLREMDRRFVYFVRAGKRGPIKIGVAEDVSKRLSSLQTAHYNRLTLLVAIRGGGVLEEAMHRRFRRQRIRGEWFRAAPDLMRLVAALRGQQA